MKEERAFERRMRRIEELVGELNAAPEGGLRVAALELVQLLMDLHGEGLERMMEVIAGRGEAGWAIIDELTQDGVASSLLLLYGLHPLDVETRVRGALEKVRPYLRSHGGNVELIGIEGDVVRLRLEGSCEGCPSSAMTLKLSIEEAICEAAPEVAGIISEGTASAATTGANGASSGLVQLTGRGFDPSQCMKPEALIEDRDEAMMKGETNGETTAGARQARARA